MVGEGFVERLARRHIGEAVKRITRRIDGFELDEGMGIDALHRRHRTQFGGRRHAAVLVEPSTFFWCCLTLGEAQLDVAAQEFATLQRQAVQQRLTQRADAGDRGDAQNQAREEDAET